MLRNSAVSGVGNIPRRSGRLVGVCDGRLSRCNQTNSIEDSASDLRFENFVCK